MPPTTGSSPTRFLVASLALTTLMNATALAAEPTRLLRFPDIHTDTVAFVYGGDVYVAPSAGGEATRLTSHEGLELYPKFSPDGRRIAFSAEYSGNRQVYVMDVDGGNPRQLTWYNDVGPMPPRGGTDYRVLDWTPDGRHVVVRANRLPWGQRMGRPYLVPVDGGMEQPLPVPETGGGMLSPDGRSFVYTPVDREFRTWKRYRGGRAQDIWVFDLENTASRRLTDHVATDHQPVWVGEDIYFVSDRDYTLNLYRHAEDGEPERVTDHEQWDVLWPSAGPDSVVYENGGYLYRYVPGSGSTRIGITVPGSRPARMPGWADAGKTVFSWDVSPDGQRAVFDARGEIFTVPAKHGPTRNITASPGVREIHARWSPDGKQVAFYSDATGEYELYVAGQDGSGQPRQVTRGSDIWRQPPAWSPDGAHVAFSDQRMDLWIVAVAGGMMTRVDTSAYQGITDYRWSPDGRYLVYTKRAPNGFSSIFVHDRQRGESRRLTSDSTHDFEPAFDPEGRFLFFLSNRDYNLSVDSYEVNRIYTDATRIYAGALAADGPVPFPALSDEVGKEEESAGEDAGEKADDPPADDPPAVDIDFDGFESRVLALPGKAADYRSLQARADGVYVIREGPDGKGALQFIALEERKDPETLLDGVNDYRLSADGKRLMVASNGGFALLEAKTEGELKFDDGKLDLSGLQVRVDPVLEWRQMYADGWRLLRDWFYDPGMHGMDWPAIRRKYEPLVDHVAHRADLDYIFGEIAGELNAGHVYVQSAPGTGVERVEGGLLGAELTADESGYFRIESIMPGENWHDAFRSPLTEPGVGAAPGDYILAVNGRSTKDVDNIYALLENTADEWVELSLNDRPVAAGARTVMVRPIAQETNLRYLDWVASRRAMADELSGGRVGYVHLPNTAQDGHRELYKQLFAQIDKDALIIDDRYNGGGFIPDRMAEMLSRKPLNYWKWRGAEPVPTPLISHDGPKAMLINGQSSSGGDALPYYFRKLDLGPLIGTRTWGGLIGISGNPSLADGGVILAPTFRFIDTEGQWAVENEGVAPDIEVIDRPDLVAKGQDPSLERAVEVLLKALEDNPPPTFDVPPAPTDFR